MITPLCTRLIALSTRLLQQADISVQPFRALVRTYLIMDLRNQHFGHATATGAKDTVPPLFWVVGQYLLVSGIVSGLLFARVDAFFFALVGLAVSMAVMATAIIVEFNEVVLNPSDLDVMGHLPIPLRTYAAARLTNLLAYVLLVTVALNIFPAIVGVGLRDADWLFLPAYALAALLGNLGVACGVILLYTTVLSSRLGDTARNILAWTQIILIMVAVYGGQAMLRDANDTLEMLAYHLPRWIMLLPPAWLATFVDGWAAGHLGSQLGTLAVGFIVVGALCLAVMRQLTVVYAQMQLSLIEWRRVVLPPLPQPGALAGRSTRYLKRSPEETAAYWLCTTMLKRDHELRMRSWPALGAAVALPLLGLVTAQLGDPFTHSGASSALSLACLYVLAVPIPVIMHNLTFSQDHAAAWVLWSAPVVNRYAFAEGMRKAVTYRLLMPLLVALGAVFAMVWGNVIHALVHGVVGWLLITGVGYATQRGIVRTFPFSAPLARGQTMGSIALFAALVNGTSVALAVVHSFSVQSVPGFTVYVGSLVLLMLILRRMAYQSMQRRFAREIVYA